MNQVGLHKRSRFGAVKPSLAHMLLSWFLTKNDLVEMTLVECVLHISLSNHVRKHVMKVILSSLKVVNHVSTS